MTVIANHLSPQFGRFLTASGLATISHWLLMGMLVRGGISPVIATTAGAVTGATVNYGLQKTYTFKSSQRPLPTLGPYFIVCLFIWLLNYATFSLLHFRFGLHVAPAQFFTSALVSLFSYLMFRRIFSR